MEAVKKARERFAKYPILVAQCHEAGAKYATCVLAQSNLKKNSCETEFNLFRNCLAQAAAKNKTRL